MSTRLTNGTYTGSSYTSLSFSGEQGDTHKFMSTRKVWRCHWPQPQINLKRITSKIISTITPAIADTAPQTDMRMLRKYFIKDNLLSSLCCVS